MPDPNSNDGPSAFDVDYKLLPPSLQMKLWLLSLDADTSKVNLAYKKGFLKTSLEYSYGGSVEASVGIRRFTGSLAFNPSNKDVDLGLVFKGFNFKASASPSTSGFGVNVGYGAPLLPMPAELTATFQAAGASVITMGGDSRLALNDPLKFYSIHSDDVDAITKAVSAGQSIAKTKSGSESFGVGLRLNYTPATGLVIYGGAQLIW